MEIWGLPVKENSDMPSGKVEFGTYNKIRVQIVGNHPHTGEYGTLTNEVIDGAGASMIKVMLENCLHGTEACFARRENIKLTVSTFLGGE